MKLNKSESFKEIYNDLPKDPDDLIRNSQMARHPEVTLEDFLETRPDKEWERYALNTGADITSEYNAQPLSPPGSYPIFAIPLNNIPFVVEFVPAAKPNEDEAPPFEPE